MIGLFRLVVYAFVAYLVWKFIRKAFAPPASNSPSPRAGARSGVMVKDEVCQTYLPREDAIPAKIDGRERFFCSEACRAKFLALRRDQASGAGRPTP